MCLPSGDLGHVIACHFANDSNHFFDAVHLSNLQAALLEGEAVTSCLVASWNVKIAALYCM